MRRPCTPLMNGLLPVALYLLSASALSQNAPADGDHLKQTLLQAREVFGLGKKGSAPFHLKAHFDAFNDNGRPIGSGTLEEYWDGNERYRTETVYQGASQTVWHSPATSRLGDALREPYFARRVVTGFLQPLPPPAALDKRTFEERQTTISTVPMHCIVTRQQPNVQLALKSADPGLRQQDEEVYCLSADNQNLRVEESYPGLLLVYNKLAKFGTRTIPFSVKLSQNKTVRADFEVDTLETWKPDDAFLTPPPSATMSPISVSMSGGIAAGNIVEKIPPVYPLQAKLQHVQGSVVMAAVISHTGTIDDLEVIASPALSLSEAATEAVKRWKYKPYLLNGNPVDVDTTITVNFSFGTSPRP